MCIRDSVRTVDPEIGKDIDEVENISSIVSAMVEQRTSLGLSQRELAAMSVSYTHLSLFFDGFTFSFFTFPYVYVLAYDDTFLLYTSICV